MQVLTITRLFDISIVLLGGTPAFAERAIQPDPSGICREQNPRENARSSFLPVWRAAPPILPKLQFSGVDEIRSYFSSTRDGVYHVGIHQSELTRTRTPARGCVQCALIDAGLSNLHETRGWPARLLAHFDVAIWSDFVPAGPAMTVDSVKGNQVDWLFASLGGALNVQSFPSDVLQRL